MKGRPPIVTTEEELITHYIGVYYRELSQDPKIRFNQDDHIKLIESINKRYLRDLKLKEGFDEEKFCNKFIESIDFLTKVFSKKKEQEAVREEKRGMWDKVLGPSIGK